VGGCGAHGYSDSTVQRLQLDRADDRNTATVPRIPLASYGVIVLNPNENVDEDGRPIRGSEEEPRWLPSLRSKLAPYDSRARAHVRVRACAGTFSM
jgi:hypothetical protein